MKRPFDEVILVNFYHVFIDVNVYLGFLVEVCLFVSITCYKLRRRKLSQELTRFSDFASVAA